MKNGFVDCKKCVHLIEYEVPTNVFNRYTREPERAVWYRCDIHPFPAPITTKYSCIFFNKRGAEKEVEG